MEPTRVERKIAAILSADVKGYSRLMGEDEVATIRTLTAYRELMASLIQQHRGRVVDTPGDNLLAEFGSVVDAVTCAVEVQREHFVLSNLAKLLFIWSIIAAKMCGKIYEISYHFGNTVHSLN